MVLFIAFQLYSVFSDGIFTTLCFWIVTIIFSANGTGSNWVLGQLLSHWSKRKVCKRVSPELSKWIFCHHILLILSPLWPLNADFDAVSCQRVLPSHFLGEIVQVSYPITLCVFPRGIFRPIMSCLSLISEQSFWPFICQGEIAKMSRWVKQKLCSSAAGKEPGPFSMAQSPGKITRQALKWDFFQPA